MTESTPVVHDEMYYAWRESEAYQVPMTQEGVDRANLRWKSFQKGWQAHKKFIETFMDKGCIERGCPCYDPRDNV
jgi:hypothetical protein